MRKAKIESVGQIVQHELVTVAIAGEAADVQADPRCRESGDRMGEGEAEQLIAQATPDLDDLHRRRNPS